MTRRGRALVVSMAMCGTAVAADHPHEALKLILKQNTATGKAKAVWVSKTPPPVLPALPPTSVGGAFVVTGVDEQVSAPLPAADWGTNAAGTLYKFVNKLAPGGSSPCKVALVKDAKVLKVVCKDSLIQLDDSAQGTVAMALTVGADTYCSVCATARKDEPGKYVAKGCGAPADCRGAVPARVCGNGVIEVGEQCDGESYCVNCRIPRYACCEFGSGESACAKAVPAVVLFADQYEVCGRSGGTFMTGLLPTGTAACPDPTQGTLGPCGGPAPAFPMPISVCCQATETTCYADTVADGTQYSQWFWTCAYPNYFSYSVVLGTCGDYGRCVPPH